MVSHMTRLRRRRRRGDRKERREGERMEQSGAERRDVNCNERIEELKAASQSPSCSHTARFVNNVAVGTNYVEACNS